jgi:rhodanese-related sulfurtransferase
MLDDRLLPNVLDVDTLRDLVARQVPVTILDVRTPAEFEAAHIPGSYNVPLDQFPEHARDLGSVIGEPVVLVCRCGTRARQAAEALYEAELPRLHVLDGGLTAWEMRGLPVTRGRQRWSLERQVRGLAGVLVLAGIAAGWLVWPPLALLAAGVGAGLAFSAITDTCGLALLLGKLPYNRGAGCDIGAVLHDVASRQQITSTAPERAAFCSSMRHSPVSQESWS